MKNSKLKVFWTKLLRDIGVTSPILLTEQEKRWIMLCKGWYKDKYRTNANNWIETLKPMFEEIYGWSADDDYKGYLQCMFNKLLDIFLKIHQDGSGRHVHLKDIFGASFGKSISRNYELPIERAIAQLCGEIQYVTVIENGVHRFNLK